MVKLRISIIKICYFYTSFNVYDLNSENILYLNWHVEPSLTGVVPEYRAYSIDREPIIINSNQIKNSLFPSFQSVYSTLEKH